MVAILGVVADNFTLWKQLYLEITIASKGIAETILSASKIGHTPGY
jgi:hypothetical protein